MGGILPCQNPATKRKKKKHDKHKQGNESGAKRLLRFPSVQRKNQAQASSSRSPYVWVCCGCCAKGKRGKDTLTLLPCGQPPLSRSNAAPAGTPLWLAYGRVIRAKVRQRVIASRKRVENLRLRVLECVFMLLMMRCRRGAESRRCCSCRRLLNRWRSTRRQWRCRRREPKVGERVLEPCRGRWQGHARVRPLRTAPVVTAAIPVQARRRLMEPAESTGILKIDTFVRRSWRRHHEWIGSHLAVCRRRDKRSLAKRWLRLLVLEMAVAVRRTGRWRRRQRQRAIVAGRERRKRRRRHARIRPVAELPVYLRSHGRPRVCIRRCRKSVRRGRHRTAVDELFHLGFRQPRRAGDGSQVRSALKLARAQNGRRR